MNTKRVIIATVIGLLAGIFCATGTWMMAEKGELTFFPTLGLLASIVYNRVLIGMFIGYGDNIKLHPVARGAFFGLVVTMAMSIIPIFDGDLMGGLSLMPFGIVYGIIIDVVATRLSRMSA
jgi:hypothetical protein